MIFFTVPLFRNMNLSDLELRIKLRDNLPRALSLCEVVGYKLDFEVRDDGYDTIKASFKEDLFEFSYADPESLWNIIEFLYNTWENDER